MREEHSFLEAALAVRHNYRRGDAGKASEMLMIRTRERERNERRTAGLDGNRKPAGNVVAEPGGAHLWNRKAAGGDNERGSLEDVVGSDDSKGSGRIVAADLGDSSGEKDAHASIGTFAHEQIDNLLRGAVAEELAERFLVIRDAVPLNEPDKICGRVARERRFGEVGIGGEEIAGLRVQVGEVAAASAGDEDLLARPLGALEDRDTASAAAGFDGGHEARSATAEDEDIETVGIHGADFID